MERVISEWTSTRQQIKKVGTGSAHFSRLLIPQNGTLDRWSKWVCSELIDVSQVTTSKSVR